MRDPFRVLWAAVLCAAGTWEAIAHPGRPLAAGIGAGGLYFAASLLCEPLRADIDHPDKSRLLLCWDFARVLVAHCTLPAIVLFGVASGAIATAVIAGTASPAALAVIPTVLAPLVAGPVVCAALNARRGGRIDASVLLGSSGSDPSGGGHHPRGAARLLAPARPDRIRSTDAAPRCSGSPRTHGHRGRRPVAGHRGSRSGAATELRAAIPHPGLRASAALFGFWANCRVSRPPPGPQALRFARVCRRDQNSGQARLARSHRTRPGEAMAVWQRPDHRLGARQSHPIPRGLGRCRSRAVGSRRGVSAHQPDQAHLLRAARRPPRSSPGAPSWTRRSSQQTARAISW